MYTVDNAVIMAAGTSSRFAPLSLERPKALIDVKGEVLIERQIRQLREAGIPEIYIVVGYKAEQFAYLKEKFNVRLIYNREYLTRNNHSSIYAARHVIGNTYICSADNYFTRNPFEREVDESYYAALYADRPTNEWCMRSDPMGYINRVEIGGSDAWYMLGHTFWSEEFSKKFINILNTVYDDPQTRSMFWEDIFAGHLDVLKMQIRRYDRDTIFEFDNLDELRAFDSSYVSDTRSVILKQIAVRLHGNEADISAIRAIKGETAAASGIRFRFANQEYEYTYSDGMIKETQQ